LNRGAGDAGRWADGNVSVISVTGGGGRGATTASVAAFWRHPQPSEA